MAHPHSGKIPGTSTLKWPNGINAFLLVSDFWIKVIVKPQLTCPTALDLRGGANKI